MNDQEKFAALNIVFNNWLLPSQKIRIKALKKLQRFCRRGSGNHAYKYMIKEKKVFDNEFGGPPVLYRQVANCVSDCDKIPIRILNKHKRMTHCVNKFPWIRNQVEKSCGYGLLYNDCFCNNKTFEVYKKIVEMPRGITARDGIRYIMCELSGDELTYYTRFKLSNYIINRLK